MREINTLIWHYTATPPDRAVSVAEIRAWHKARGWSDIGYHWVVLLNGRIEAGRPEAVTGSHAKGHNAGSLGLCYVGGGTGQDTRSEAQKWAMGVLTSFLVLRYPIRRITGHRGVAATLCPGFDADAEYRPFIRQAV